MTDRSDGMTTAPSRATPPGNGAFIPGISGGWPLVGHLLEFSRDPVAMLVRRSQEQGEIVRFRLGPREFVLFSGPEAHDFYFRMPEDHLDPRDVYQFTVPVFGRGVAYDVAPELMDEQLGFLFPALRKKPMERFARIMFAEAERFAGDLGEEGEIDLPHAMNELTVKAASHCLIGEEIRQEVDSGFAETYHDLQKGMNVLGFFYPRLPTPAHRTRDRARRQVTELFSRIMNRRRRSGSEPEDFMQTLMHARYKDGRALSDDEITGILLTVLFAGQHTSAVLATWSGLEILNAPSYLARVRNEIAEVYQADGVMSFASLQRQPVLERAVRECERLHPPLIILIRKALKPLHYKGHVVPAGTLAMVSPAASHRLPHVFADPEHFLPDRFAPPACEDRQHDYALIGFGGGKHKCMGKNFAYMQLKAIWSVLFNRFEFSLDMPVPGPDYGSWVTGPKAPCRVRYRRQTPVSNIQ